MKSLVTAGLFFLFPFFLFAQPSFITVHGTISSSSGEPLTGVSIVVKGTHNGTTTGADGSFQLSVPRNGTLAFSHTGYVTREVKVGAADLPMLSVKLDVSKNDL